MLCVLDQKGDNVAAQKKSWSLLIKVSVSNTFHGSFCKWCFFIGSFLQKINKKYTLYRNWSNAHFHFLPYSRFEWEPLKLRKQMVPHFLAFDVSFKICKAQLCSSIRGCHATFLVKNTLFKGEVAWKSCKSVLLVFWNPPTRACKWDIVCPSTIITFEEIRGYVKKCLFLLYKINIFWHNC